MAAKAAVVKEEVEEEWVEAQVLAKAEVVAQVLEAPVGQVDQEVEVDRIQEWVEVAQDLVDLADQEDPAWAEVDPVDLEALEDLAKVVQAVDIRAWVEVAQDQVDLVVPEVQDQAVTELLHKAQAHYLEIQIH